MKKKKKEYDSLLLIQKKLANLKVQENALIQKVADRVNQLETLKKTMPTDNPTQLSLIKQKEDSVELMNELIARASAKTKSNKDSIQSFIIRNDSILKKTKRHTDDSIILNYKRIELIGLSSLWGSNKKNKYDALYRELQDSAIHQYNLKAQSVFTMVDPEDSLKVIMTMKKNLLGLKLIDTTKLVSELTVQSYINLRKEIQLILTSKANTKSALDVVQKIDHFKNTASLSNSQKETLKRLSSLCQQYCSVNKIVYEKVVQMSTDFLLGDLPKNAEKNLASLTNLLATTLSIQDYPYLLNEINRLISLAKAKNRLSHRLEPCQ